MSGYLLGGESMPTPLQIQRAKVVVDEVRDVLNTVSQRPAIKTSGHRGTVIAYAELTRLKQWLSECSLLLTIDADPNGVALTRTESGVVERLHIRPMSCSQLASELNKSPRAMLEVLDELIRRRVVQRTTEGALQFYLLVDSSGIHADDDRTPRFPGETFIDRMRSQTVKDILQSMRDYESWIGVYFDAHAWAAYVKANPDWAVQILIQLEDSGDVMKSTDGSGHTLWHVLA